jgi:hypothetical protein
MSRETVFSQNEETLNAEFRWIGFHGNKEGFLLIKRMSGPDAFIPTG